MDETLMHCVDDVENDECDVILDIDFGDDDIVYAGINIRPHIKQCLREASHNFMIIVFTASHQIYADAILDYIDQDNDIF